MKTVRMIALRNQYYGRDLKTGEEFDVEEKHVPLLERVGAAQIKTDEPADKNRYKRRDLRAES